MWKYIGLKQNNVDPSPEARAQLGAAVDFVFKFAEYTLITGVFWYLAKTTQHWAVTSIAAILALLLDTHLLSLVSGLQYFLWKDAENKALKFFLWLLSTVSSDCRSSPFLA